MSVRGCTRALYRRSQYAYYDSTAEAYACCDSAEKLDDWDTCARHFTVCNGGSTDAPSDFTDAAEPASLIWLKIQSAGAVLHPEEADGVWLRVSLGEAIGDSEIAVSIEDAQSGGLVAVGNLWAGPSSQFYSTRTDEMGSFAVSVAQDTLGSTSSHRELFFLPFFVNNFLASVDDADDSTLYVDELPHSFVLQTARDPRIPSVVATHNSEAMANIQDETIVQLTVEVFYANMDDDTGCGVPNVLMCAYSATHGQKLSCNTTEVDGSTTLTVPPGTNIVVRTGCGPTGYLSSGLAEYGTGSTPHTPEEMCDQDAEVVTEHAIVVLSSSDDDTAVGAMELAMSGEDVTAGGAVQFQDTTTRTLTVLLGAGRSNVWDNTTYYDDATLSTLFSGVRGAATFALKGTANPTGCTATFAIRELTQTLVDQRLGPYEYDFPILPLDLAFEVAVVINEDSAYHDGPVATYLHQLPTQTVEGDSENSRAVFLYRKAATIGYDSVTSDDPSGVAECTNGDTGYGFARSYKKAADGTDAYATVQVALSAFENYTSAAEEVDSDFVYAPPRAPSYSHMLCLLRQSRSVTRTRAF